MAKDLIQQTVLRRVIDRYLSSGDFNGFFINAESGKYLKSAVELVRAGALEVVSEQDYINVHIRPWSVRRSIDNQVTSLEEAVAGEIYGVCLYPTAAALDAKLARDAYAHEPYRRRLAEGGGTLDCAFFRFEVLEVYRNDPRFSFEYNDFGVNISVNDDVFMDPDAPEADKIAISHTGFAYALPKGANVRRYVCAFLIDLARLSPEHQQRWRTFEVNDDEAKPHAMWFGQMMGHWADGLGPFERFMAELRTWNQLHESAFSLPLLKTTERPREFGWVLRDSQHEFDIFITQTDKLLSENLRPEAFDKLKVADRDEQGQKLGTLKRLDLLLERNGIEEDLRQKVLQPLRDVRSARQKPAHVVRTNVTDSDVIQRQIDLLGHLNYSLQALRVHWQSIPANRDWREPEYLQGVHYKM